jgi:hypothetical protein
MPRSQRRRFTVLTASASATSLPLWCGTRMWPARSAHYEAEEAATADADADTDTDARQPRSCVGRGVRLFRRRGGRGCGVDSAERAASVRRSSARGRSARRSRGSDRSGPRGSRRRRSSRTAAQPRSRLAVQRCSVGVAAFDLRPRRLRLRRRQCAAHTAEKERIDVGALHLHLRFVDRSAVAAFAAVVTDADSRDGRSLSVSSLTL